MGQLPHVFNDEIVTYPANGASDKMSQRYEFVGLRPDILGDDAATSRNSNCIADMKG
jgi:hypothetical protein